MTYRKVDLTVELKRMARGKKTKLDPWLVAELALGALATVVDSDEVAALERLYRLPDPRLD